jgi:Cu/Ag efflux protein CusF
MRRSKTLTIALAIAGAVMTQGTTFAVEKQGETGNDQPEVQTVTGIVQKHDDDVLTIKDQSGKLIHLHMGKDTVIPGLPGAKFKPGDRIEASVTTDGHAKSVQIPN